MKILSGLPARRGANRLEHVIDYSGIDIDSQGIDIDCSGINIDCSGIDIVSQGNVIVSQGIVINRSEPASPATLSINITVTKVLLFLLQNVHVLLCRS